MGEGELSGGGTEGAKAKAAQTATGGAGEGGNPPGEQDQHKRPAKTAATLLTLGKTDLVWQLGLAALALIGLIVALALEWIAIVYHQQTVVMIRGASPDLRTTTVTGPSAPSGSAIGAVLAGSVLLLLVASFFTRISNIVLPGGAELDINNATKLAGAVAKVTDDQPEAEKLFSAALPVAAGQVSTQRPVRRVSAGVPTSWRVLSDDEALNIVKLVKEQG